MGSGKEAAYHSQRKQSDTTACTAGKHHKLSEEFQRLTVTLPEVTIQVSSCLNLLFNFN